MVEQVSNGEQDVPLSGYNLLTLFTILVPRARWNIKYTKVKKETLHSGKKNNSKSFLILETFIQSLTKKVEIVFWGVIMSTQCLPTPVSLQ